MVFFYEKIIWSTKFFLAQSELNFKKKNIQIHLDLFRLDTQSTLIRMSTMTIVYTAKMLCYRTWPIDDTNLNKWLNVQYKCLYTSSYQRSSSEIRSDTPIMVRNICTHIVSYVPLIVSNIHTFMGTLGTCEHIQWICTEETVGAKLDVCEKAHIVWARERTFTHIHIYALTHTTTVSFELD